MPIYTQIGTEACKQMLNLKQRNCAKSTVSPRSIEYNYAGQYSKLVHQSHHALGYRFVVESMKCSFRRPTRGV